jgi:hypothetical protein
MCARATKGDVTPAGEKFGEILRQLSLTRTGADYPGGFGEHAAAMENVADVLSKNERLTLLRLLKKLGNHAAETRK